MITEYPAVEWRTELFRMTGKEFDYCSEYDMGFYIGWWDRVQNFKSESAWNHLVKEYRCGYQDGWNAQASFKD